MIIDVNLDYYCISKDKTNREIISEGGSPVVPNNESYVYQIHHIGQKKDSPFAIIPENIHNGKNTYSFFHQGSEPDVDLHTKEFEIEKRLFWRNYVEQFDKYGGFRFVPFLNSKHKKHER